MEKLNKISKTFLYFSALFFVVWLGSYITRQFVAYQFFEANDLSLRSYFAGKDLTLIFHTILPVITTNLISYIAFLFFFSIFIFSAKINFRNERWLFIIILIVFITAPFEIYLITFDWDLISAIQLGNTDDNYLLNLFKTRLTTLNSFSLIEIFTFFVIIYLFLFRPLRKSTVNEN